MSIDTHRDRGCRVTLYLASLSQQLHTLCEEVFRDIPNQEWTLHLTNGEALTGDADLYLWDVDDSTPLFESIRASDTWRHFFLVDKDRLPQFRELIPFEGAHILLKPVTKAALTAFLADACKRCGHDATDKANESDDGLRADRDELLQSLLQANLKLQEYDHDRTNFLARAIHDFRAPLTAVTGYCGLLLGNDAGVLTGDQREVLERMHQSAKKLSRMADAMFQLSIAPHREACANLQRGEIRDCLDHALHEIFPAADEKRITISVDAAPPPEPLYFEQTKLEQILVNLLDNACKFVPRGGMIEIRGYSYFWEDRLRSEAGSASSGTAGPIGGGQSVNSYRIDIRDSGPGIPRSHLTKIFEEYTSYGGGVDRSGGGLGLAICRMIISQHKGRIWAESSKDGGIFSFVLPFSSGSTPIDQQPPRTAYAGTF